MHSGNINWPTKQEQSTCPKCGGAVADGTRVCGSCGEPLNERPIDAAPVARRRVAYAGFWWRAAAYLIDVVLLAIFAGTAILAPLMVRGAIPADKPWFLLTEQSRQVLAIQLLFDMACWVYFASFESSSWQATPGKKIMGLVVTDLQGRRITFARASGRFFGKLLSQFLLFFGYLMAAFTARKQALHDLLAGTLVLRKIPQA
ncbi:MAG TPA: RDD family protein [Candidatus Aquilonibacter sp.]|nr:RDD family protein [Candidatus Aquilonibacter sp.]